MSETGRPGADPTQPGGLPAWGQTAPTPGASSSRRPPAANRPPTRPTKRPAWLIPAIIGVVVLVVAVIIIGIVTSGGSDDDGDAARRRLDGPAAVADADGRRRCARTATTAFATALPTSVLQYALATSADNPTWIAAGAIEAYTETYTDGGAGHRDRERRPVGDARRGDRVRRDPRRRPAARPAPDPSATAGDGRLRASPVRRRDDRRRRDSSAPTPIADAGDGNGVAVWTNGTTVFQATAPVAGRRRLLRGLPALTSRDLVLAHAIRANDVRRAKVDAPCQSRAMIDRMLPAGVGEPRDQRAAAAEDEVVVGLHGRPGVLLELDAACRAARRPCRARPRPGSSAPCRSRARGPVPSGRPGRPCRPRGAGRRIPFSSDTSSPSVSRVERLRRRDVVGRESAERVAEIRHGSLRSTSPRRGASTTQRPRQPRHAETRRRHARPRSACRVPGADVGAAWSTRAGDGRSQTRAGVPAAVGRSVRGGGGGGGRQGHGERGALPTAPDDAAVGPTVIVPPWAVTTACDDRQAEAGRAGGAVAGRVAAREPLEQAVAQRRRDAGSVVGDLEHDAACRRARSRTITSRARGVCRRALDEQVREDLAQAVRRRRPRGRRRAMVSSREVERPGVVRAGRVGVGDARRSTSRARSTGLGSSGRPASRRASSSMSSSSPVIRSDSDSTRAMACSASAGSSSGERRTSSA